MADHIDRYHETCYPVHDFYVGKRYLLATCSAEYLAYAFKTGRYPTEVVDGFPQDAQIVEMHCRTQYITDAEYRAVSLQMVIASDTFPPIPQGGKWEQIEMVFSVSEGAANA